MKKLRIMCNTTLFVVAVFWLFGGGNIVPDNSFIGLLGNQVFAAEDAVFGNDVVFDSQCSTGLHITGNSFVMPETGVAESINVYLWQVYGQGYDFWTRAAVYRVSDLTLVAQTEVKLPDELTAESWNSFSFDVPPTLVGGEEYALVIDSEVNNKIGCVSGEPNTGWFQDFYLTRLVGYGAQDFPENIEPPTSSYDRSIYSVYTPSANMQITGESHVTAGEAQTITITAYTEGGVVDTSYNGVHNLSFWGPNDAPDGTVAVVNGIDIDYSQTNVPLVFVSGVATATLQAYKAEVISLDVTDGVLTSDAGNAHDLDLIVSEGELTNLEFINQPHKVSRGELFSPAVSVGLYDAYGNMLVGDTETVVTMSLKKRDKDKELAGTLSQTASSGIVVFEDIYVPKARGRKFRLIASVGDITVRSKAFRVLK